MLDSSQGLGFRRRLGPNSSLPLNLQVVGVKQNGQKQKEKHREKESVFHGECSVRSSVGRVWRGRLHRIWLPWRHGQRCFGCPKSL